MLKSFLFALLSLTASSEVLHAATWYVSPSGNNNNSGSLQQPFKTLPRAIEAAAPGDIIELRQGTYPSAEVRVNKSDLTIRSYSGEWATLVAPLHDEDIASCIWYNEPDVNGGLLERLEIVGGYYYGVSFETNWDWGLPQRRGASNITLKNCIIRDTGRDCIKIKPACNNIHIIGCTLFNSGVGPSNSPANGGPNAEGIDNVNGDGMVVRGCYIHHTSTTGVYVKGGAKDCIVEENLITNTGEAGILLGFYTDAEFFDADGTNPDYYECQYSLARNNIVLDTKGAGIGFFATRNCSAYHNTVQTASTDFHAPLYLSPGEIWINNSTTLYPANRNVLIFNNIFVDKSGNGDEDYTVQLREGALVGTNQINHNLYFKPSGAAQFEDGVNWPARTLAQWRSQLGFDLQSLEVNPNLNAQFHLQAGSPAINAGQTAPQIRDYDGHDRSGTFDLGADEYQNGAPLAVPPPPNSLGTAGLGGTTSYESLANEPDFYVFPNPATNFIHVRSGDFRFAALVLYNNQGVKIAETSAHGLDVHGLASGVYFLEIRTETGFFFKKFLKI